MSSLASKNKYVIKVSFAFDVNLDEKYVDNTTSRYDHFSSHHMPTSQSYPNIKCIIQMIDTDSYINIACIIAKRTILSHLNVNSLYNEYKTNYMGPLFTIWIEEIYRICTNKKPFSCAYWSPLTQDLLLSSACVSVFSSDK